MYSLMPQFREVSPKASFVTSRIAMASIAVEMSKKDYGFFDARFRRSRNFFGSREQRELGPSVSAGALSAERLKIQGIGRKC
jgi:hypothetical protein